MIIIQGITIDDFFHQLRNVIASVVKEYLRTQKQEQSKLITRKEASELLRVTLPTLYQWTKQGFIQSYRIGNRVFYKSGEIEEAVKKAKYRG